MSMLKLQKLQIFSLDSSRLSIILTSKFLSTSVVSNNQRTKLTELDHEIIRRHDEAVKENQSFYEDPETKYIVWTEVKHLERGKCCGSACRHCPYEHTGVKDSLKTKVYNGFFYNCCDLNMDERHPLLVLYGSQTGTAEEISERIVMQSTGSAFKCTCSAIDDYNIDNLVNEKLIVFVCSTTGQGEPPDNMKKFWRFIMRKNLPGSCLADVRFSVLGLGDSSYPKYNFIGKKLFKRLQNLGGQAFLKLGLADDQHDWGPDAVVDPWITNMWKTLLQLFPSEEGKFTSPLGNSLPPPRFRVYPCETTALVENKQRTDDIKGPLFNKKHPFFATVQENICVTSSSHFQETRLLKFDISSVEEEMRYAPGDVAMVMPSNMKENVEEFLDILPFEPDVRYVFQPTDDRDVMIPVARPVTLRELAEKYFDFMSVPRRSFFQLLSHFAADENEKEKLHEFGTPEGTEDRYSYVNRPRRNILEVLQDFHLSCKDIPLERIFDLIPLIWPRAFSIASSPTCHKGELHLLVAVVKYKTRLHKPRKGLCSTWLASMKTGSKVPLWVKKGGINFPPHKPCILVGPGTGIAPFRAAAHERSQDNRNETVVFFGCRNKNHDFYFEDEWEKLPVKFHAAFSRDQDKKIYVQDKIRENSAYLWSLFNDKEASVFVAGNSKNMPDDVKTAFIDVFRLHGNMTSEEASKFQEKLQQKKRYQQETWF